MSKNLLGISGKSVGMSKYFVETSSKFLVISTSRDKTNQTVLLCGGPGGDFGGPGVDFRCFPRSRRSSCFAATSTLSLIHI